MQRTFINTAMRGFTIVELLIVMMVLGLLMGLIFSSLDDIYASNVREMRVLTQTTDIKTSLDVIARDVSLATSFKTVDTTDPIGPATGLKWNNSPYDYRGATDANGTRRILIMQRYATDISVGSDTASDAVGLKPARQVLLSADCATPIYDTLIFYVRASDSTLYRRTIPGATTSACAAPQGIKANSAKQSCSPGTSNALCAGVDAKIASDVTGFNIDYFINPSEANDSSKAIGYPGDVSAARAVMLKLETTSGRGTQAMKSSNSIVIALQNGGV